AITSEGVSTDSVGPPAPGRAPSASACAFVHEIGPPSDAEMWPPLPWTDISCLNAPGTDDGGGRSCETVFGFARTGGRALASTGPAASTASSAVQPFFWRCSSVRRNRYDS